MVEVEVPVFSSEHQRKTTARVKVNMDKLKLYIFLEQIKISALLRDIEKKYVVRIHDHTFSCLILTYFMMYFCLGILPPNINKILTTLPLASNSGVGIIIAVNLFIGMGSMLMLGYFDNKIYRIISRKVVFILMNLIWIISYGLLSLIQNFFGMILLISIGAIGVGAFLPIGFSMISDIFSSKQRGIKFGMMHFALVLGNGSGMVLGSVLGSIIPLFGWRLAYAFSSLLALIPLVSFMWFGKNRLPESSRESVYSYSLNAKQVAFLFKQRSLRGILGSVLGSWVAMSTLGIWSISYLSTQFGQMSIATFIYIIVGLGALPGAILGGKLGDSQHHKGILRGRIYISFLGSITGVICFFFFYSLSKLFFFGILGYFFTAFAIGNQFALYSELVSPQFRGTVNALNGIIMNTGGIIGNLVVSYFIRIDITFLQSALLIVISIWALSALCWIFPFNYYVYERYNPSSHKVLIVPMD